MTDLKEEILYLSQIKERKEEDDKGRGSFHRHYNIYKVTMHKILNLLTLDPSTLNRRRQ